MKVSQILTDKSKWTQGAAARFSNGKDAYATDPKAVKFCLLGAISKSCGWREGNSVGAKFSRKLTVKICAKVEKHIKDSSIVHWNDNKERTFEDIQKVIKELDL